MVQLNHVAIDGTKIKANASNNNNLTEKEIQTIKKIIQKGIDVDKEEDELYGENNDNDIKMPLDKEERKKLIKEIFKEIENNEKQKKTGVMH